MENQFHVYEAKTQLSKLVERVENGDEIVLARNGKPVAKIVPLQRRTKPRQPGGWGTIWIADDFDDPGGEWGEAIDEIYRKWASIRRKPVPDAWGAEVRLLLDTNAVLWWLGRVTRLGVTARRSIGAADQVLVSPVSAYEIHYKRNLGKLDAPDDLEMQIARHGFDILPLSLRHAADAGDLLLRHRDPFDRLLLAQARCEGLTLVTAYLKLSEYDAPILDAAN